MTLERREDGCQVSQVILSSPAHRTWLVIEAVPTDCVPVNRKPGNGFHGTYRNLRDVVPSPSDVETTRIGVGTAQVFTQRYYECTNECRDFTDVVAIVERTRPTDARHPTFSVRGDRDVVSRDDLLVVLHALSDIAPDSAPVGGSS